MLVYGKKAPSDKWGFFEDIYPDYRNKNYVLREYDISEVPEDYTLNSNKNTNKLIISTLMPPQTIFMRTAKKRFWILWAILTGIQRRNVHHSNSPLGLCKKKMFGTSGHAPPKRMYPLRILKGNPRQLILWTNNHSRSYRICRVFSIIIVHAFMHSHIYSCNVQK